MPSRAWTLCLLAACSSETPPPACTNAPYTPLRTVRLAGIREGTPVTVTFSDWLDACPTERRLLVVRMGAGWCGTCRWQAEHTSEILEPFRGRVEIVDVLVENEDGAEPSAADLDAFRKFVVRSGPRTLAADPSFRMRAFLPPHATLPATILVDRRDLSVVSVVTETDTFDVASAVAAALALPPPEKPALAEGRFARWEVDMARAMLVPGKPPPDPSNAKADHPGAAELGAALFVETGFSKAQIACTTCHLARKSYTDGLPTSVGVAPVDRNAPSITLAAHGRWSFWDGRADSLWSQALAPIESASEMASSRLRLAHWIADRHAAAYQSVFGALPLLSDRARFPDDGQPNDPAWEAMAPADRDAVNRVFANAGKAIAAHERTFRAQANAFDRWIAGDVPALADAEKDGLHAFFRAGCAQCHWGPRLTDDAFHGLGFPTGRIDGAPDRGRIDGVAILASSDFNRAGPFSDERTSVAATSSAALLGAFKTPTLRGLPSTAPYGHGGSFATLDDVVAALRKADARWLAPFDEKTAASLVVFLSILKAEPEN